MKKNNAVDEVFEMLLKQAAEQALDKEPEQETDISDEDIVFSAEHEKRMEMLFRHEERKARMKRLVKYSRRCACVLAVFGVVAAISIFNVDALRMRFLNFKPDPSKPNADYNFRDDKSTYYRDNDISIDYLPEGFELTEVYKEVGCDYIFRNGDSWIGVSRSNIDIGHNLDTENMTIEQLKIQGHNATLMTRPSLTILIWADDYNIYVIDSNLPGEEIVKIGENTM